MKTIIIGFDAFDPLLFERLYDEGRLPNLGKYLESGESEVSWTSIATGLDPGGHGLFDFVHRNPANYSLHVSLLPTKKNNYSASSLRNPIALRPFLTTPFGKVIQRQRSGGLQLSLPV
jgi:hypothetical protein